MKRISIWVLLVTLFSATQAVNAQSGGCFLDPDSGRWVLPDGTDCPNTVVTAVPFLRITADARSGAMGDAGIAISPDASAVQFNDSKLVYAKEKFSVGATYTPWLRAIGLTDVYLAYFSGFYRPDEFQAIGGSIRFFNLGSITYTNENGQFQGEGNPNEWELKGSYARKLSDNFSAGLGAKFIYSNLANGQIVGGVPVQAGISGAADISATYQKDVDWVGENSVLRLGGAITNIGAKISYTDQANQASDYIPTNLGIGGALEMDLDEYNSLTFTFDINKLLVPTPCLGGDSCDVAPVNGIADFKEQSPVGAMFSSFGDAPGGASEELRELTYSIGLEYWYAKQFAVRAGYYNEHFTKGNRKYFTAGIGLKYNVFGLNVSYLVPTNSQRGPLDNTLRFSMLFDLGATAQDEVPN